MASKVAIAETEAGRSVLWSDLRFDYVWRPYSKNKIISFGVIDDSCIDCGDGYQVLGFINAFMARHRLFSLQTAHKIERLINQAPPHCGSSRMELCTWLEEVW